MRLVYCIECNRKFKSKNNKKFCSDDCRFGYWCRTNKVSEREVTPCEYCGMPATSVDHVPPRSSRDRIVELGLSHRYEFVTVNACIECNTILGACHLWTVQERKDAVKKRLKIRYRKYLDIPDWRDTDLQDFDESMAAYIKKSVMVRDITVERIKW